MDERRLSVRLSSLWASLIASSMLLVMDRRSAVASRAAMLLVYEPERALISGAGCRRTELDEAVRMMAGDVDTSTGEMGVVGDLEEEREGRECGMGRRTRGRMLLLMAVSGVEVAEARAEKVPFRMLLLEEEEEEAFGGAREAMSESMGWSSGMRGSSCLGLASRSCSEWRRCSSGGSNTAGSTAGGTTTKGCGGLLG